jgi:AraC-like DNA-binding protein
MTPTTHKQFSLQPSGNQLVDGCSLHDYSVFSRQGDLFQNESSPPPSIQATVPAQAPMVAKTKALLVVFDEGEEYFYELLVGFLNQQRCFEVSLHQAAPETAPEMPSPSSHEVQVKKTPAEGVPVSLFLATEHPFLAKINQLIEKHLDDDNLRASLLAKACFMCEMQLHRRLKKLANLSPANYIRKYRLWRSKPMLENPKYSITDVCYRVGFRSLEYFSRSFKEEFGVCPMGYKKLAISQS